ncbi:hypothetical protein [Anaerotignum propionicum]|uniref:Uncharacterized protein n=1 Tax=Anaerotignum propionicum DSM 1682 TaxID=991789 RepID=A0A0X1U9H5_ANAPI|nr:hypothetical protein [Anaerotignum propionicum]AMJ41575.1 hypothetical protein CPRO_19930 [Anaerotignum propionicum DSM 1682]SHE86374.1 hypothetical protein SAMN02745151_02014 [[Clostridium] propionicum DSM 1682] [Anaerotignum propionicum DSM 1682]
MDNENLIIIPSLSSFENTLGIYDRKIKGAVFIPNKSKYINLYSLQSALRQLIFLDLFGWVTNEKGFQRGNHRIKKLFDLYNKKEIDMAICYSKEVLLKYEFSLEDSRKSIKKSGIPIYCIKDCILIKEGEMISLS